MNIYDGVKYNYELCFATLPASSSKGDSGVINAASSSSSQASSKDKSLIEASYHQFIPLPVVNLLFMMIENVCPFFNSLLYLWQAAKS